MIQQCGSGSASLSSNLNSSSQDTEDGHTIAEILAEEERLNYDGRLGKRLSHLDSIPHTPWVIGDTPDPNDATLDHGRFLLRASGLAELQIQGDGNCQFRALTDQSLKNPDYHKKTE
ncbi:Hypothetical predicted protein [Olea europaea subsp. europaea]|uniref:OTU domain-containing protein n=1 Tax=Olea europaea subsp. europaea TaxID=158383 RepID=A0A8S0QGS0_OLEEU|nr:Hypothetical predicted protein [Olea europaea subsp. europaea]